MEIDKSRCDGGVMRYQSTNLLQVKREMIPCLEKRTWLEGIVRRRTVPRLFYVLITMIGVIVVAYVNRLIFPLCLVVTFTFLHSTRSKSFTKQAVFISKCVQK